jgi:hypothetical protein
LEPDVIFGSVAPYAKLGRIWILIRGRPDIGVTRRTRDCGRNIRPRQVNRGTVSEISMLPEGPCSRVLRTAVLGS